MAAATGSRLGYVPALDGLRAVSVLLVVSFHVRGDQLAVLNGGVGVLIFFVLSGFLITTLGSEEEAATGRVDLPGFFIRRAARILPLFTVTLAAFIVAVLVVGLDDRQDAFRDALPYYLLFLPEIPVIRAAFDLPFGVAWSLGIEEKFYLGWSLLGFGVLRAARPRAVVAAVLLGVALVLPEVAPDLGRFVVYYAYVLVGVLLALARTGAVWERLAATLRHPAAGIAAASWLAVLAKHAQLGGFAWPLLFAAGVAALVVHLIGGHGPLVRAMSTNALVRVGRWSYGIYLIHQLALALAEKVIPEAGEASNLLTLVVGLPLAVAGAAVLSHLVEQPAIRWGRSRASARRSERQAAVAPVRPGAVSPTD